MRKRARYAEWLLRVGIKERIMTLESIGKLREALKDCTNVSGFEPYQFDTYWITAAACDKYIDEIEREIAEKYMERPCDMDGRPLFFGDEIEYTGPITKCEFDRRITVRRFTIQEGAPCNGIGDYHTSFVPSECRYVKPRTIEDVLEEFYYTVLNHDMDNTLLEQYADELRSMGVGE